jgi:hypothetical protein
MHLNLCTDHEFAMWAFGDAWLDYLTFDMDAIDLMKAWNERHGDKLRVNCNGLIMDDMKKMKEVWEEYGQKDSQNNREHEKGRKGHRSRKAPPSRKGAKGRGKAQ